MRDMLFRGFYPDENRKTTITINGTKVKGLWVFGYYVFRRARSGVFGQTVTDSDFDRHIIITDRGESYEVIPETVGQCTVLKDKNGKKIFEGDVCNYGDYVGVIGFDEDGCKFILTYDETDITDFSCIWGKELEVIGNIFEKTELLEVK